MKKKLNVGKVLLGLAVVAIIGGGFYAVSLQQNTDIRSQAAQVNPVTLCTKACAQVTDKVAKGKCALECKQSKLSSDWSCLKNLCAAYPEIKMCDVTCGKMSNTQLPKGYAMKTYKSSLDIKENQVSSTKLVKGPEEIVITEEPASTFSCNGVEQVLGSTTACREEIARDGVPSIRLYSFLKTGMLVKVSVSDPKVNDGELTKLFETFK